VQRPIPDALHQDVNGLRAQCPQTVQRGNLAVGNGPVPRLHVNGDVLSEVVGFDLRTDVPLVYLLAQAGDLIPILRRFAVRGRVKTGVN
jgi:hypothetical protein